MLELKRLCHHFEMEIFFKLFFEIFFIFPFTSFLFIPALTEFISFHIGVQYFLFLRLSVQLCIFFFCFLFCSCMCMELFPFACITVHPLLFAQLILKGFSRQKIVCILCFLFLFPRFVCVWVFKLKGRLLEPSRKRYFYN